MNIKHYKSRMSVLALMLGMSQIGHGEVAVVVHPSVTAESVPISSISNLFLGKTSTLPDGTKVEPIDQEEGEAPREEFYTKVVKKDASQLNAYWSRLIFTGKGQPPKAVLDDDEVVEIISADPGVIGYIDSSSVDDSVKVLLLIP